MQFQLELIGNGYRVLYENIGASAGKSSLKIFLFKDREKIGYSVLHGNRRNPENNVKARKKTYGVKLC
jgi:hypothetical protein